MSQLMDGQQGVDRGAKAIVLPLRGQGLIRVVWEIQSMVYSSMDSILNSIN